ncbi:MAG: sensor histidine kinase [Pseudozobellia sp.]|nr:sensor histidine kinase [Pseudozobellia sp.]|tara:strand:+ start:106484 stop:107569 length:1086 start_codon:yes stop_codon:yes gene_type:complete
MQQSRVIQFIFRYKLHHIPFWIVYHLVWLIINFGSLKGVYDYLYFTDSSVKFYFYLIFQMLGVYFNLYYLIPKFLYRRRFALYLLLVVATILACNAIITSGYYVADWLSPMTFEEMYGVGTNEFFKIFFVWALPTTVASMTLGMSIKLGKNWLQSENKRLQVEKDSLETELKYLKSQINPHFLFNTINSIFALIHKNPDLASESLANFSDMLRHQLYDCDDDKIPLEKELEFIQNFIDLESLRLDAEQVSTSYKIDNQTTKKKELSPFVLLPFVENAFKHVSKGKKRKNFIRMNLLATNERLHFTMENTKDTKTLHASEKGIGLQNIKRRLNLVYPDSHFLKIEELEDVFKVEFKLLWSPN